MHVGALRKLLQFVELGVARLVHKEHAVDLHGTAFQKVGHFADAANCGLRGAIGVAKTHAAVAIGLAACETFAVLVESRTIAVKTFARFVEIAAAKIFESFAMFAGIVTRFAVLVVADNAEFCFFVGILVECHNLFPYKFFYGLLRTACSQ